MTLNTTQENKIDKLNDLNSVKPVFMRLGNISEEEFKKIELICTKSNGRIDFPSLLMKLDAKRTASNIALTPQWVQCEQCLLDDYLEDHAFANEVKEKKYFAKYDKFVMIPGRIMVQQEKRNSYINRRLSHGDSVFQAIDNATNKELKTYYKLSSYLISHECFKEESQQLKRERKNVLIGSLVVAACMSLCTFPLIKQVNETHHLSCKQLQPKQIQKINQNQR